MSDKKDKNFHCGMVAIVGRPNVGKSTLLNCILEEKVAIVSPVPQTTRNQVRGIYNNECGQIVFVDTPGLHFGRDQLDRFMNHSAYGIAGDVDCLIYLVDVNAPVGQDEQRIAERLSALNIPIIFGLNKVDAGDRYIPEYISLWEKVRGKSVHDDESLTLLPLSPQNDIHIHKLVDILLEKLPEGPPLYPRDTICDVPQRMAIADIIREKLFLDMRQEVPHSIAVVIEEMEKVSRKTWHIRALILVEKESHKMIVIGKSGQNLKNAGVQARAEIEQLLESKVFLESYVKVKKNWRDDLSLLEEMGYVFE